MKPTPNAHLAALSSPRSCVLRCAEGLWVLTRAARLQLPRPLSGASIPRHGARSGEATGRAFLGQLDELGIVDASGGDTVPARRQGRDDRREVGILQDDGEVDGAPHRREILL